MRVKKGWGLQVRLLLPLPIRASAERPAKMPTAMDSIGKPGMAGAPGTPAAAVMKVAVVVTVWVEVVVEVV